MLLSCLICSCGGIDWDEVGINAFVNEPEFGTPAQQFSEVQTDLGLSFVRVLFDWNDAIQSAPGATIDFSFYDDIINSLPDGVDALVILTGIPSWMEDSSNWINNNPRLTFVSYWVSSVIERYGSNNKIVAWEVWNEPNMTTNNDNVVLQLDSSPENYVEMLQAAYSLIREKTPDKLIVGAATTSINEDYPHPLHYNRGMKAAGAEQYMDKWGLHYYGKELIHFLNPEGGAEFLNTLTIPIWMTESGQKGSTEQLQYVQEIWPIIIDSVKNLERIYIYQFTEDTPADSTYGLRTMNPTSTYSNLYNFLKDRHAN